MASQSAGISVGVSLANTSLKRGRASAAITTGVIETANPYSGGTTVPGNSGRKVSLPPSSIPIGTVDSQGRVTIDPVWYRTFDFFFNHQLGGPSAPSIADLSTATVSTRAQAIQAQTDAASVGQQVNVNAQSLAVVVQVAQNNNLNGAAQIPAVAYSRTNPRGFQP